MTVSSSNDSTQGNLTRLLCGALGEIQGLICRIELAQSESGGWHFQTTAARFTNSRGVDGKAG